ncbi:hypothetical protein J31TS4_15330 [Paenibacillus sp. J31TS4]|nr:hypothetical protein J31TS4_15330 [Paenibacillus sp. J31TS4]
MPGPGGRHKALKQGKSYEQKANMGSPARLFYGKLEGEESEVA